MIFSNEKSMHSQQRKILFQLTLIIALFSLSRILSYSPHHSFMIKDLLALHEIEANKYQLKFVGFT